MLGSNLLVLFGRVVLGVAWEVAFVFVDLAWRLVERLGDVVTVTGFRSEWAWW